jgi:hypothetical protein
MRFQSFFMLMTIHPSFFASSHKFWVCREALRQAHKSSGCVRKPFGRPISVFALGVVVQHEHDSNSPLGMSRILD